MKIQAHLAAIAVVAAAGIGNAAAADKFTAQDDNSITPTTQFRALSGIPAEPLAQDQLAEVRGMDASIWIKGVKLRDIPGRINGFQHGTLCVGGGASVFKVGHLSCP